jgi:hypothetical protein
MFPPMSPLNERVRAQLENQQLEKAAAARSYRPARRFNFRNLLIKLPRLSFLKLQRNLK